MAALILPSRRVIQPQGPVEVDWSNPHSRGLVLVDGLAVAQNRVTKRTDVVVGTKLVPAPSGVMRGFGSTVGSGTTDSIETTLNTATAQKTIFVRMRRDGLGGGSLGRVFDKRVSSAEVETCLTTFSPANYLQYGVVFSGGSRLTYWNLPTAGQNISLVLTADNTITNGATAAAAYFDGVLQTVQSSTSTTGTANTNTDNYVIGNRKNDNARNFDGLLSDFLMWNRILSDAEIASISANPWQLFAPTERRIWVPVTAGGGGTSQTIAFTLDDLTASVSQTLSHSQSAAFTLDDVSASVSQALSHDQVLGATLDDVTASISQSIVGANNQSLSITLDDVTASVSQTASHAQSVSATLDDITASASQTASHAQSLAVTLDDVTVSINQSAAPSSKDQSLAITLDDIFVDIKQAGPRRRQAGGKRNYIIKGKKYHLNDYELAVMIQGMLEEVERSDVEIDDGEAVKKVSRRVWKQLKESNAQLDFTLKELQSKVAIQEIDDEDDIALLML